MLIMEIHAQRDAFTQGLGVYDDVLAYDGLASLDATISTACVDMSGDGPLIVRLHGHFRANICTNIAVGITHWEAARTKRPAEGAPPSFFFAPAQILKREKE